MRKGRVGFNRKERMFHRLAMPGKDQIVRRFDLAGIKPQRRHGSALKDERDIEVSLSEPDALIVAGRVSVTVGGVGSVVSAAARLAVLPK